MVICDPHLRLRNAVTETQQVPCPQPRGTSTCFPSRHVGSLALMKYTRALVVLAQKLTEEVDELKSRIHELEAAIETARLNDSSSNGSQSRFPSEEVGATADDGLPGFSNIINELVAAFPLGKKDHGYSMRIFELYMPLKQEALHSICCFYEKSSYMSDLFPS